nr:unnamed protein product [Callosobruchus analis]
MNEMLETIIQRRNRDGMIDHNLIRRAILQDIFESSEDDEPEQENIQQQTLQAFNLEGMDLRDAKMNFRFNKEDIPRLCEALRIPARIVTSSGYAANGVEGLCIFLRRLAYPNRLYDLERIFNRSSSALSEIISYVNRHIYNEFGGLLEDLNNLSWLNQNRLQQYADAIAGRGARVRNCWGFIDGTARPICRPSVEQENYYSGHKRVHCLKYQCIVTPDGMTVSLLGAFEGRRHDAGIFRESHIYAQLENKVRYPNGCHYVIYGDLAYGIRELLLCPYPGRGMNEEQHNFNASMCVVREAVEWSFNKIISEFAFLDFKKNQKLLLQEVETMYKTATILTNCHTCLYGNQTSTFFNIDPISINQYLNSNVF